MCAALRLRCQTKGGLKSLDGLMPTSTIADLLLVVSQATAIPAGRLKVKVGFPPKPIDTSDTSRTMSDLEIRSGDKITVDEVATAPGAGGSPSPAGTAGTAGGMDRLLQQQLAAGAGGILQRKVMPADNSCLFTAINALMTDGSVSLDSAEELRRVIAGVVSSDPETYSEGFLGQANSKYVQWILNKDSWGGGIELAILANHFQTEIAVVDCQSARIDRFGEDKNFRHRIFLLYDGVHYDSLVLEAPDSTGTILEMRFSSSDDAVILQAMDIAREAQSSGQFTDVSGFSLRCLVCRTPLKGQKEAQQHAMSTGHQNYGEYRQ
ncbi:hypothetical protein ACOMHN_039945 [Nucella lapillus]